MKMVYFASDIQIFLNISHLLRYFYKKKTKLNYTKIKLVLSNLIF